MFRRQLDPIPLLRLIFLASGPLWLPAPPGPQGAPAGGCRSPSPSGTAGPPGPQGRSQGAAWAWRTRGCVGCKGMCLCVEMWRARLCCVALARGQVPHGSSAGWGCAGSRCSTELDAHPRAGGAASAFAPSSSSSATACPQAWQGQVRLLARHPPVQASAGESRLVARQGPAVQAGHGDIGSRDDGTGPSRTSALQSRGAAL